MTELEAILAHADVQRIARSLDERPGREVPEPGLARRAATALVLRVGSEDDLELLMIKRAEHEGDPWSGHVALPGGRHEPGDADLVQTAIRETWEETGVDLERNGRVLGALDELGPGTPVLPPIIVRPYVAVVASDVQLVPSFEVAAAFWVPLAQLRLPGRWVETTVRVRGGERVVPSFRHGEHVVWGLTERMLREFTARLG